MDDASNESAQIRTTAPRGFAVMDPKRHREIARQGGMRSGGQFGKPGGADPSEAGRKGGQARIRRNLTAPAVRVD